MGDQADYGAFWAETDRSERRRTIGYAARDALLGAKRRPIATTSLAVSVAIALLFVGVALYAGAAADRFPRDTSDAEIASSLAGDEGAELEDIRQGAGFVGSARRFAAAAVIGSVVVGAFFMACAALVVWNSVRLSTMARRREVTTMQLVGATETTVIRTFVVEGVMIGIIGGIFAAGGLIGIDALTADWIAARLALDREPSIVTPLPLIGISVSLVALGAVLGGVCSRQAAGRLLVDR